VPLIVAAASHDHDTPRRVSTEPVTSPAGSDRRDPAAGVQAGTAARRGAPVRLDRLTKTYDDVVAVDDISLEIAAGEFVSLLGPSGSGKTTTLMMVAGFQDVTSGSITVGDREISQLPPFKRDIGVVFQHYALFPHMRVAENVGFALKMRRISKSETRRRVEEALRLVQLEGYGDRFPRQLSGGQQQRVALARAVVFEPGLALMDEPLGALDRHLREQMQFEIKRLHRALGITVLYVTHDQEEALVMSDRIAVINHGKVEQFATPSELYNEPSSAFVATFVGESNVLAGDVIDVAAGEVSVRSTDGHRFVGRSVQSLRPGDRVTTTIRPEKLVVTDAVAAAGDAANSLPVTCFEVTYAGQMSRYVMSTRAGEHLVLRVQNRPGSTQFSVGETVTLTWAVDDLRIFPAHQLASVPSDEGPAPASEQ
jgi:putative spermidine/putrescine transport system ATP-binding protein